MARLSDRERADLKRQGYVYDRRLKKWMHHEEQKEYYRKVEQSELIATWIMGIFVAGIFVWMFIMFAKR